MVVIDNGPKNILYAHVYVFLCEYESMFLASKRTRDRERDRASERKRETHSERDGESERESERGKYQHASMVIKNICKIIK